jgi:Xaa-Pro aminopeptidase
VRQTLLVVAALLAIVSGVVAQQSGVAVAEYKARRAAVSKAIGPNGIFIAVSPEPARRTGDIDWPFRQEDNLLYLTGLNAPDTTLVLLPGEREHQEQLFTTPRDPSRERWTGKVLSADEVAAATGVREVFAAPRFNAFIERVLQGQSFDVKGTAAYLAPPFAPTVASALKAGRAEVWLLLGERESRAWNQREQRLAAELRTKYPELTIRNASPMLDAMREIKSPAELALIQRAVDVTVAAQKAAMVRVLTAMHEYEVEATIEFTFRNMGACCWAFPSIVAAGRNSTTLHYESNNDPVIRNGLLLTDLGAEVEGYSADVTRTYPASGVFSPEQRALYDVVYKAQNEGLAVMRPGHRMMEVEEKAQEVVGRELLKLGLVTKNVREQSELYLFHSPGHPLGLQTHDVYDRTRTFEPNMVFTNEPGVYVRQNDVLESDVFKKLSAAEQETIRKALAKYDGIGIRIEDDVLITMGEPKIMSAGAPRPAADVEALMAVR